MMVIEATRLPKRTAASGSADAFSALAAPAEKLSPAPQISTGFSTRSVSTHRTPAPSTISAPLPPCVTISSRAFMRRYRAGKSTRPNARVEAACASSSLGLTITPRNNSARRRESTQTTISGCAAATRMTASRIAGVTTPPLIGLRLVGDDDHVVRWSGLLEPRGQLPIHFRGQRMPVDVVDTRQVLLAGRRIEE